MPFYAALSTNPATPRALDEVCAGAAPSLGGPADLALLFFSPHHADELGRQAADLQQRLGTASLLGCSGESIVGNDREIEQQPALSLWLARWKRPMKSESFHLTYEQTKTRHAIRGVPESLAGVDPKQSVLLVLGDPFSSNIDLLLRVFNDQRKGLRILGGMASGGQGPGQCKLLLGGAIREQGAVGVLLSGPNVMRTFVSQGCRPVGRPLIITRAQNNLIQELEGKSPLAQVQEIERDLSSGEQLLVQRGLLVRQIGTEPQDPPREFPVRTTLGFERESGSLAVNGPVAVGQTVQFHIRDAESADAELRLILQKTLPATEPRPGGALLFTCNRRGSQLFAQPNHDAAVVRAEAGNIPVAGILGLGEIGPVGDRNYVLGHSATCILFDD